jgi:hypothetical protein
MEAAKAQNWAIEPQGKRKSDEGQGEDENFCLDSHRYENFKSCPLRSVEGNKWA